jgi:hypothetical protein
MSAILEAAGSQVANSITRRNRGCYKLLVRRALVEIFDVATIMRPDGRTDG